MVLLVRLKYWGLNDVVLVRLVVDMVNRPGPHEGVDSVP